MSFELIETVTVGAGGAASIEFTSIPQDGTDLVLQVSLRSSNRTGVRELLLSLNGGSSISTFVSLFGLGTSVFSSTASLGTYFPGDNTTANTFSNQEFYFSNYVSSSSHSISGNSSSENNDTGNAGNTIIALSDGLSAAITSIELSEANGSFATGSTASLYKITAA